MMDIYLRFVRAKGNGNPKQPEQPLYVYLPTHAGSTTMQQKHNIKRDPNGYPTKKKVLAPSVSVLSSTYAFLPHAQSALPALHNLHASKVCCWFSASP